MTNLSPDLLAVIDDLRRPRAIPPPPALASYAARLYAAMAPVAWLDGEADWALAKLDGAIGTMFQAVEDVARDTPAGPGWSSVVDATRCPDAWLPWLGQFVGVVNGSRNAIVDHNGFQRGTPAAIRAATAAHLTGSKTVVLQERFGGDAYALAVYTLDTETPNPTQTRADILTQKPGGIVLTYAHGAPNTYAAVNAGYATYAAVKTAFSTYSRLAVNQPG
jgi:hypothetical protein